MPLDSPSDFVNPHDYWASYAPEIDTDLEKCTNQELYHIFKGRKRKPLLRKTSTILTFTFTSASKATIMSVNDLHEDVESQSQVVNTNVL